MLYVYEKTWRAPKARVDSSAHPLFKSFLRLWYSWNFDRLHNNTLVFWIRDTGPVLSAQIKLDHSQNRRLYVVFRYVDCCARQPLDCWCVSLTATGRRGNMVNIRPKTAIVLASVIPSSIFVWTATIGNYYKAMTINTNTIVAASF